MILIRARPELEEGQSLHVYMMYGCQAVLIRKQEGSGTASKALGIK